MSFMRLADPQPLSSATAISSRPRLGANIAWRSYGWRWRACQIAGIVVCGVALVLSTLSAVNADAPVKIVALGDSLTAGFGLDEQDGFVSRLQAALAAKGMTVQLENAGVSGDTASDGLARLDWSVPDGTAAVILELGANDMLRGISPDVTRSALDTILDRLAQRHIAVLLCGMLAAPNLGSAYGQTFDKIYPQLASKYGVLLYPFFLDGVVGDRKLIQADGLHPNPAGVDVIVARILPAVEQLISRIPKSAHPS